MVTNYQLSRREGMNEYLDSLKKEAIRINGDESVIWLAKDFLTLLLNKLVQQNKVLEVPDCCPNNNQEEFKIFFTWNKDEHYLECEIFSNNIIEFFYRNRFTKEDWSCECDFAICQGLGATELFEKLSLFVE